MTVTNPEPDSKDRVFSAKCKCGCRFTFAFSEAKYVREPVRFLFVLCPECNRECCKCLDDEPKLPQRAVF